MAAESTQDRIINGLLKGFEGTVSPEEFEARLHKNIEIVVAPSRAGINDLWPAIWALASVLERQVRGQVFIHAGLEQALSSPIALGSRVRFVNNRQPAALTIVLGANNVAGAADTIIGDARDQYIAINTLLPDLPTPSPIECFILAGYVGFRALAALVQIPDYREDLAHRVLEIPNNIQMLLSELRIAEGFTSIGQGQVGQAFLALLYFLYQGDFGQRRLHLIDPDSFEFENQRTQILLREGGDWLNERKVFHVAQLARSWNAVAIGLPEGITWSWQRGSHPPIAFIGLHDFESRRMACAAAFKILIECGVGTDLLRPRVSWHVLRGNTAAGKALFTDREGPSVHIGDTDWVETLKNSPGQCGWVQFLGISATAPSLGVAAVGFAVADYGRRLVRGTGVATLWSQLLPPHRANVSIPERPIEFQAVSTANRE